MDVQALGIIDDDPYPSLHLRVDGVDCSLPFDQQKPTLTLAGLTYLGPDWADRLPPIDWHGTELRGFTDDPGVARHFCAFLDAIARPPATSA
jgi:hypothetical protein